MTAASATGTPFTVIRPDTDAVSYGPLLHPDNATRAARSERRDSFICASRKECGLVLGNDLVPADRGQGREHAVLGAHVDVRGDGANGAVGQREVQDAAGVEAAP